MKKRPVGRPRKIQPEDQEPVPKKPRVVAVATPRPRSPTQVVYSSYNMSQKKEEVKYAKEHTVAKASQKYHVADSTLRGWMKIDFDAVQQSGQCLQKCK